MVLVMIFDYLLDPVDIFLIGISFPAIEILSIIVLKLEIANRKILNYVITVLNRADAVMRTKGIDTGSCRAQKHILGI